MFLFLLCAYGITIPHRPHDRHPIGHLLLQGGRLLLLDFLNLQPQYRQVFLMPKLILNQSHPHHARLMGYLLRFVKLPCSPVSLVNFCHAINCNTQSDIQYTIALWISGSTGTALSPRYSHHTTNNPQIFGVPLFHTRLALGVACTSHVCTPLKSDRSSGQHKNSKTFINKAPIVSYAWHQYRQIHIKGIIRGGPGSTSTNPHAKHYSPATVPNENDTTLNISKTK